MKEYILGIESSCDETSAAVVDGKGNVLSNIIISQIDTHKIFGGVVPEIASRMHVEEIAKTVDLAISRAGIKKEDLKAIAVANRPGLIGALLVGLAYGKALSYALKIPLIPVHHLRGHLYGNFIGGMNFEFPALGLIVSGGHTTLIYWESHEKINVLGETLDDAVGEVFDKVARAIKLGYPGGPLIEKEGEKGNPLAYVFPKPKVSNLNFSFSGLKSSVLSTINTLSMKNEELDIPGLCASFQKTVGDTLESRVLDALLIYDVKSLVLAGGVIANKYLKGRLKEVAKEKKIAFSFPEMEYCTDNGAMIAMAGFYLQDFGGKEDYLYVHCEPNAPLI